MNPRVAAQDLLDLLRRSASRAGSTTGRPRGLSSERRAAGVAPSPQIASRSAAISALVVPSVADFVGRKP